MELHLCQSLIFSFLKEYLSSWGARHGSCLGELSRNQDLDFASESGLRALSLLVKWKGLGMTMARNSPGLGIRDATGTEPRKVMT